MLPILFLISGIGATIPLPSNISCLCWVDPVFKAMLTYEVFIDSLAEAFRDLLLVLYVAFILVTTLWCTLMIIFHILNVGGASTGSGRPFKVYRHVIEILVESAIIYAIFLLLDIVFAARLNMTWDYTDVMAAFARV